MAPNPDEYVYRALKLTGEGLRPFVKETYQTACGSNWQKALKEDLKAIVPGMAFARELRVDAYALIQLMLKRWGTLFKARFNGDVTIFDYLYSLRATRCRIAHWVPDDDITHEQADQALATAALLLRAVASPEAGAVTQLRKDLTKALDGGAAGALKPEASVWPRGYKAPDSPDIELFVDPVEEGDYLAWIHNHPSGFVVNAPKPSPNVVGLRLHAATCGFISGVGKNLVGASYFKVCSESRKPVEAWLDNNLSGWKRCGVCKP